MELYETEKSLVLKAEFPEVDQDDIELRIDDDRVTLRGKRPVNEAINEKQFVRWDVPTARPIARSSSRRASIRTE